MFDVCNNILQKYPVISVIIMELVDNQYKNKPLSDDIFKVFPFYIDIFYRYSIKCLKLTFVQCELTNFIIY